MRRGALVLSEVPPGFPTGPIFGDVNFLKGEINKYTENPNTCGGGFAVCKVRSSRNNNGGAMRESFGCAGNRARSKKEDGCTWEVTYEHTTDGWQLVRYHQHTSTAVGYDEDGVETRRTIKTTNHHSHELKQTMAEMRARHAGQCQLPEQLEGIGDLMSKAGLPTKEIMRVFQEAADEQGLDSSQWSYDLVYRRFTRVSTKEVLWPTQDRRRELATTCSPWDPCPHGWQRA